MDLHEKNIALYQHEEIIIDETTGEVLAAKSKTVSKTSLEPDFIKVYYETMMAFNRIHDIPVSFLLSLSKFIEWSNEGSPLFVTLNKRAKEIASSDCKVDVRQIERYIKKSVDNGLLFRTEYRAGGGVNPFMIAKGKWESIKKLRSNFDYVGGKWVRTMELQPSEEI